LERFFYQQNFLLKSMSKPQLTLVGAGPGDPELITLKAIKALQNADAVLYDDLANEVLLQYAPQAAHVYVGKRSGKHSSKQEEINELIVKYALEYGHVVRLKGGDPFIFGRASEEIATAENFNIPVTIVPGISSSTALPALHQVPITQRNVSEGFWVMTATVQNHRLASDLQLAAQSSATVIILMGVHKLPDIVDIYQTLGKNETPIMIIQNGSLPNEKVVIGTIDTILAIAQQAEISTPAIMVIGEVVKKQHHLSKMVQNIATLY
jgi:uroporphyrin-III C-methyltransferase